MKQYPTVTVINKTFMMIIVRTIPTQAISMHVRQPDDNNTYTYTIRDKMTLEIDEQTVVGTSYINGLLSFDITYSFIVGRSYILHVYNEDKSKLLNRSLIYCTDAGALDVYDPIEDYYKEIEKPEIRFKEKPSS